MQYKKLLAEEAKAFIDIAYMESEKNSDVYQARWKQIETEIAETGHYTHTLEELRIGAKLAWRNSNRCIGRFFWESLHVLDCRADSTEEEVARSLFRHIRYATNGGRILPVISLFAPASPHHPTIRIWNYQLIRYAGYQTEDGIIGDPDSIDFTNKCLELGWKGPKTDFDILPILISLGDKEPKWFSIPSSLILEVPLEHPEYEAFAEKQYKWYAVPIVSDMKLEIGGLTYQAAPFNGWYMGTEVGARNLADAGRYNLLPEMAEIAGLDTSFASTLWKDRALVELNRAVLHSYKKHGVSMVDHHTAAAQFERFEKKEAQAGREVTGDWTWLIPPVSPATTSIFHKEYNNHVHKPNYFYQDRLY